MIQALALVIATKDRPADLRRLLSSLGGQTRKPDLVVIVDASATPDSTLAQDGLVSDYVPHRPPSASAQRNAGLARVPGDFDLIGFCDDDTTFEPDAFERMLAYWDQAGPSLGGAAFNIRNYTMPRGRGIKTSRLAGALGLYSRRTGGVAPSGWQAVFGTVPESTDVDWLPSTAVVWSAEVLRAVRFDEFFDGYSYLEDLDLSYAVSRSYRLAVVADAGYSHFPSQHGRTSARDFGRVEVRNRLYFVRKHGLSVWRCYAGLVVRLVLTLSGAIRGRDLRLLDCAAGNIAALAASIPALCRPRPV